MADSVKNKTKKKIKKLGQDSFEKLKEEPREVARSAKEQVSGQEAGRNPKEVKREQVAEEKRRERKDKQKSERLVRAHKKELEDIRKAKKFKEIQNKIQEGEDVNISVIEGLTEEQKEALRSQKEKVKKVKEEQEQAAKKSRGVPQTSSKPKRGLIRRGVNAAKKKVDQMKTRIETRFKSMG